MRAGQSLEALGSPSSPNPDLKAAIEAHVAS